jgi:hypothetical protein
MDHESLHRKLARLEEEIGLAQSRSLPGSELLAKVSLSLDDAIRVAANIRSRLAGALGTRGQLRDRIGRHSAGLSTTD